MKNEYQLLNKQKQNPGNNQICKLDNKNKENQYQCDLFMPKSNPCNPRFSAGHYGTLDLQRQTSIEAHNASVPMRMPYPSILLLLLLLLFGWSFWERRKRRMREKRWRGFEQRERSSTLYTNTVFGKGKGRVRKASPLCCLVEQEKRKYIWGGNVDSMIFPWPKK